MLKEKGTQAFCSFKGNLIFTAMAQINKAPDELTSFSGPWNGCVDVSVCKAVGLGLERAAAIYSNGSGKYLSSIPRHSSPEDSLAKTLAVF